MFLGVLDLVQEAVVNTDVQASLGVDLAHEVLEHGPVSAIPFPGVGRHHQEQVGVNHFVQQGLLQLFE